MEGKNKMAGPDFLTSLVLIGFGAAVVVGAMRMKVFRTMVVSPGLFPMILGSIFILFGLIIFVMSLRRGGFAQSLKYFTVDYYRGVLQSPRFYRGGVIFLLILAYVLLFGNSYLAKLNFILTFGNTIVPVNTGFILVTAGYLFANFVYLKSMTKPMAALVSLVSAVLIFLAFSKGFGIPIP